jgi:hypothetical protein
MRLQCLGILINGLRPRILSFARPDRDTGPSTFLQPIRPEDLEGPLSAFQGTANTEDDTRRLARDLRRLAQIQPEEPPDYAVIWTKLKEELDNIKTNRISQVVPNFRELFHRKTFEEHLSDCTHQTWLDRYSGARET